MDTNLLRWRSEQLREEETRQNEKKETLPSTKKKDIAPLATPTPNISRVQIK
jgi:hypothetical protein